MTMSPTITVRPLTAKNRSQKPIAAPLKQVEKPGVHSTQVPRSGYSASGVLYGLTVVNVLSAQLAAGQNTTAESNVTHEPNVTGVPQEHDSLLSAVYAVIALPLVGLVLVLGCLGVALRYISQEDNADTAQRNPNRLRQNSRVNPEVASGAVATPPKPSIESKAVSPEKKSSATKRYQSALATISE